MAADLLDEGTPQERLERSRKALARQFARRRGAPEMVEDDDHFDEAAVPTPGFVGSVTRAARLWWRHHPVHTAVDFARPALEDYAQQQPLKLVGIAAGTGAALTLLKYWKVLSIGGIAVAMLKSSDLTGTLRTLISPVSAPHDS